MFVCCGCCVLSGRGLCDELITRPEESYRLWCVVVCDLQTSIMRRPWPTGGPSHRKQTRKFSLDFSSSEEKVYLTLHFVFPSDLSVHVSVVFIGFLQSLLRTSSLVACSM